MIITIQSKRLAYSSGLKKKENKKKFERLIYSAIKASSFYWLFFTRDVSLNEFKLHLHLSHSPDQCPHMFCKITCRRNKPDLQPQI